MRMPCLTIAWLLSFALHAPAQTVAAVQEGPGKVVVFPARDPSHQTAVSIGDRPHEIELAPDGRTAYVSNFGLLEGNHKIGTPGTTISVVDLNHPAERARFKLPAGFTAPHGMKLRPPKYRELFTNAEEGSAGMVVFDAASGIVLRTFPLPPGCTIFSSTPTAPLSSPSPSPGKSAASTPNPEK